MKQAILLHGTGGSDKDYYWFADTKKFLESNGYSVWWPLLPNTEEPELGGTLEYLDDDAPDLDSKSIVIGHSSACPLILAFLQISDIKVKQVVLVSGYYEPLPDGASSMLPDSFDWETIRKKADAIVLINSNNDPWGCHDRQAREPAIKLGATLVVATNQGHMGSASFKQPYKKFSLLKQLLKVS